MSTRSTATYSVYAKDVILVIIILTFSACRNINRANAIRQGKEYNGDSFNLVTGNTKGGTLRLIQEESHSVNEPIRILSLYKVYDPQSSSYDSSVVTMQQYSGWKLNKTDILHILKNSRPISGTELDLSYLVLPFWYEGRLIVNGRQGTYKVNAASFITLQFNDTTIHLVLKQ